MVSFTQILLAAGLASQTVFALPAANAPCTYPLKLVSYAKTKPGESIKLLGNTTALGSWDLSKTVTLTPLPVDSPYNYTAWTTTVTVDYDPSGAFEYKYIWVKKDGSIVWEKDRGQPGTPEQNHYWYPIQSRTGCNLLKEDESFFDGTGTIA